MGKTMKILIFMTQFYLLNGAERLAVELAKDLNKFGIHADILSMYTEDLPNVAQAKQCLLDRGIPNVNFLGMKIHPPITSLIPAILKLRKLFQYGEYDIVETSMMSPTVLAAWATRGTRTRQIAGIHRSFSIERFNTLMHKAWRYSCNKNQGIRYYAISNYVKECWLTYSNSSPQHTRTVYNGIPDNCFEAIDEHGAVCEEFDIPKDAKIGIFVGRLLIGKGIDTILEAVLPILVQQNLYILYVGEVDTPEAFFPDDLGLLDRLKERIRKEGIEKHIRFIGRRNDVSQLMASSDVLVHPARTEGFGLILAEAMAAGLPIVASNVEGIPEVLEGTDSILVPPGDPKALREAVLKTLNRSKEEAAVATKKGRRRAETFRIGIRTSNMIALYRDVMNEKDKFL